jgi:hypothetical protein
LELGGKAPVLVFRVLVADSVAEDFVAALTERAKATRTGLPHEDVAFGPLNNADQLAKVSGLVERLPEHATVTAGGARVGEQGYFFAPPWSTGCASAPASTGPAACSHRAIHVSRAMRSRSVSSTYCDTLAAPERSAAGFSACATSASRLTVTRSLFVPRG